MKNIIKWLFINFPQILLICGFFVLIIASFMFSTIFGLISFGVVLIIFSILLEISD